MSAFIVWISLDERDPLKVRIVQGDQTKGVEEVEHLNMRTDVVTVLPDKILKQKQMIDECKKGRILSE